MIWHEQGTRGWSIDLFEIFKHLKQTVLTLNSVDILFNLMYWLYANCCCCLHKFWPLKREHRLPSCRPNTEENDEKQQQLWYFQTSHIKTQTSNVSCSNLAGGHPTCFLHWDIFLKRTKKDFKKKYTKKPKASHSVERGELCLCLTSMHLWQEKAHHPDFLWHQWVLWSLISVVFHHKSFPVCECKDLCSIFDCSAPCCQHLTLQKEVPALFFSSITLSSCCFACSKSEVKTCNVILWSLICQCLWFPLLILNH